MTKISHEILIDLFAYEKFISDYPYILGHKLLQGTEHYDDVYAKHYKQAIKENGYSVVDNGLWELGDSIDYKLLYELGEEYRPSHLILPDCLNNREVTTERTIKYLAEFGNKSTPKFMAVVQGQKIDDLIKMMDLYNSIDSIEVIAVPLYSLPSTSISIPTHTPTGVFDYKFHRVLVVQELVKHLKGKKLHLLGCITPDEFLQYDKYIWEHIQSVDTSVPITYGLNGVRFTEKGVGEVDKPKEKIAEILHRQITEEEFNRIAHNVRMFKRFVK